MKTTHPKTSEELRMNADEFDRIMGQAMKVKPATTTAANAKKKPPAKLKPAKK